MIKIKTIKKLSTASSFIRGFEYYHSGKIQEIQIDGQNIYADVAGTSLYKMQIQIGDEASIKASCRRPAFLDEMKSL